MASDFERFGSGQHFLPQKNTRCSNSAKLFPPQTNNSRWISLPKHGIMPARSGGQVVCLRHIPRAARSFRSVHRMSAFLSGVFVRFSNRCSLPAALSALCLALLLPDASSADDRKKTPSPAPAPAPAPAADGAEKKTEAFEYIRITRDDRRLPLTMETPVITFRSAERFPGVTIDLVGAVHLGEAEYYEELNKRFSKYDMVLFEAVMSEAAVEAGVRPGGKAAIRDALPDKRNLNDAQIGFAAISVLQLGMKDALGMEFQLETVDYTPDNFVHADMTSEEFEASMKNRGESFGSMLLSEMGKSMSSQKQQNPVAMNLDMLISALSSDRVYAARRIAASQLAKEGAGEAFADADGTSTIITERNRRCFEIMEREIKDKKPSTIAIFYGAGHFADMEKRLTKDYGFTRSGEEWIVAWKLRNPKSAKAQPAPGK